MKTRKPNFIWQVLTVLLIGQLVMQNVASASVLMRCGKTLMSTAQCTRIANSIAHCPTMGAKCCCARSTGVKSASMAIAGQPAQSMPSISARCQTVTQVSLNDRPALSQQMRQWSLGATAAQAPPLCSHISIAPQTTTRTFAIGDALPHQHLLLVRAHGLRAPPIS
ncbi:MAG: hypothetical protein P4L33_18975 [Capsulimonadaceae bacterium]|nr:hypothetical protein [Capsulimonadaceae bacterium]